jgi:hypothetical protein
MTDSIFTSLIRGRILSTVAGTASAAVATSMLSGATGTINELALFITALLGLVSAIAALYSKLREMARAQLTTLED